MGLLSIFQRNKQTSAKPAKPGRGGRSPARQAPLSNTQNPDAADAMREVRARARTRLMGATVLLLVGVIGFPLLFETQPRPVPVDLPIEIPSRNAADAGAHAQSHDKHAAPAHLAASGPAPESVSYDARSSAPAAATAVVDPAADGHAASTAVVAASGTGTAGSASRSAYVAPSMGGAASGPSARPARADDRPDRTAAAAPASRPAAHAAPVLPPAADARPGPAAILAGTEKPSDAAAGAGRFVVQVGAFLEEAKVRDARAKVEKLGLKTYTQPVETPTGKRTRVRVGPYATKAEADRIAARLKADGLTTAVLAL